MFEIVVIKGDAREKEMKKKTKNKKPKKKKTGEP